MRQRSLRLARLKQGAYITAVSKIGPFAVRGAFFHLPTRSTLINCFFLPLLSPCGLLRNIVLRCAVTDHCMRSLINYMRSPSSLIFHACPIPALPPSLAHKSRSTRFRAHHPSHSSYTSILPLFVELIKHITRPRRPSCRSSKRSRIN